VFQILPMFVGRLWHWWWWVFGSIRWLPSTHLVWSQWSETYASLLETWYQWFILSD